MNHVWIIAITSELLTQSYMVAHVGVLHNHYVDVTRSDTPWGQNRFKFGAYVDPFDFPVR